MFVDHVSCFKFQMGGEWTLQIIESKFTLKNINQLNDIAYRVETERIKLDADEKQKCLRLVST